MKLILYVFLLSLLVAFGCESHRDEDLQQRQEDERDSPGTQIQPFPEKGGNAGNK